LGELAAIGGVDLVAMKVFPASFKDRIVRALLQLLFSRRTSASRLYAMTVKTGKPH
jgi:hypothetical protein